MNIFVGVVGILVDLFTLFLVVVYANIPPGTADSSGLAIGVLFFGLIGALLTYFGFS